MKFIKLIVFIFCSAYLSIIISSNIFSKKAIYFLNPANALILFTNHRGIQGFTLFFMLIFFLGLIVYIFYKIIFKNIEKEFEAPIKIKAEEIKALYKTNFGDSVNNSAFRTKTYYVGLKYKYERTGIVIKSLLQNYSNYIPAEKFKIIEKLIQILEEFGGISSVSRYFGHDGKNSVDDKEFAYKGMVVTDDGLTSYDILAKVSLYDHTLNVLEEILKIIQINNPKSFELLVADCTIVALAHDIGKIRDLDVEVNYEINGDIIKRRVKLSSEVLNKYNHNILSSIIFKNLYPVLEDDKNELELSKISQEKIVEAIACHHDSKASNNALTKYLIEADKNARKEETRQFFINKIKNENSNINIKSNEDNYNEDKDFFEEIKREKLEINSIDDLPQRTNIIEADLDDLEIALPELNKNKVEESSFDEKAEEYALNNLNDNNKIEPIKFDFTNEEFSSFMNSLANNINTIGNKNTLKSLICVTDDGIAYFSLLFIRQMLKKHLWTCQEHEIKGAVKYLGQYLCEKKYAIHIQKDIGIACMKVKKNGSKGLNKFFCIPLDALSAFNISKEELLQNKANSLVSDLEVEFFTPC